jgi:hypothetical protein
LRATQDDVQRSAGALRRFKQCHGFLADALPWHATSGRITNDGAFTAGKADADVSVQLGTAVASETVTVGEHDIDLPLVRYAQFATAPHGYAYSLVVPAAKIEGFRFSSGTDF